MALSRPPALQLLLDELHVDFNTGRKSVDNPSDGRSMTFAEGGQSEYFTKGVAHLLTITVLLLYDMGEVFPFYVTKELMMAVPATATVAVVMVVSAVIMAVVASATLSTQLVDNILNLFVCRIACFHYMPLEIEIFPCQWVVQVYLHLIFCYFKNFSEESLAVLILQRKYRIDENILMVEMAIDAENVPVKIYHALFFVITVCLVLGKAEVEFFALVQIDDMIFKFLERNAKSSDEVEWFLIGGFFNELRFLFA